MVYITIVALPGASDITITWLRGSEKSFYLQLWVFCGYQIWITDTVFAGEIITSFLRVR